MAQADNPIPTGAPAAQIPDKLYFRIGEVARLLEVAPYVLRFWESEFPHLRPSKGGTGQRLYRRRDVETAFRIRDLLYREGYTIPGARQLLQTESRKKDPLLPFRAEQPASEKQSWQLRRVKAELKELSRLLGEPAPGRPAHAGSLRQTRSRITEMKPGGKYGGHPRSASEGMPTLLLCHSNERDAT